MIQRMIATVGALGALVLVFLMALAFARSCHNETPDRGDNATEAQEETAVQGASALPEAHRLRV